MKTGRNICGAIALLTLIAAPLSAQEKIKEGKAGNIARQTEGVHRVVNRLTIGSKRAD